MSIFDDIRRDREAGTPGDWNRRGNHKFDTEFGVYAQQDRSVCSTGGYSDRKPETYSENSANARRIARVPELERIALAAEELAKVFPDIVGYLEGLIEDGCPKCGGDCSGANPPVSYCPMKSMNNDLARANAAIAKLREATA